MNEYSSHYLNKVKNTHDYQVSHSEINFATMSASSPRGFRLRISKDRRTGKINPSRPVKI